MRPFSAAIGAKRSYFNEHTIAVHGRASGVGRNKNIAGQARFEIRIERGGVGNHEAEAIAMHAEAADQRVASAWFGLRDGVAIAVDLAQFAFLYQSIKAVG